MTLTRKIDWVGGISLAFLIAVIVILWMCL